MRNTLLSRPLGDTTNVKPALSVQPSSIRLVAATPSATGLSSEASSSFNNNNNSMSFESSSWGSFPSSVLAPKLESAITNKRKIVPKKSKLGLLNVVGSRDKENRRLDENSRAAQTGDNNPNSSFEIYVDSTMDPDIGEILMVKKKKSRAALDGMHWGPLGEVTNVPASGKTADDNKTLRVKGEEKGGWWTIGRGRKDSKDKSKEGKENPRRKSPESRMFPMRSKTPEPLKPGSDARARFNSLDSGTLLNVVPSHIEPEATYSRSGTPTLGGLLAPPSISSAANANGNSQGSIAVRAMRSVRSLAQIGGWAQSRKESGTYNEKEKEKEKESKKDDEKKEKKSKKEKKEKEKDEKDEKTKEKKSKKSKKEKDEKTKDEKKKEKKSKKEKKEKEEKDMFRQSTSSFEAGALSLTMPSNEGNRSLGKKVSILGLGLPSSMRLPKLRSGSTASSLHAPQMNHVQNRVSEGSQNRFPVESGSIFDFGRGRSSSVLSTLSSLRPVSTISNHSRTSGNSHSNGSGCSVRWDEEGLETVKEVRRKEREEKAKDEKTKSKKDKKKKKADKEKEKDSRRSTEGRKRTAITDIFPDIAGSRRSSASLENGSRRSSLAVHAEEHVLPLLTVEEATNDGHGVPADYYMPLNEVPVPRIEIGTPNKKARPRPVSEQMLGKSRPRPMYQDDEDNAGVLSLLDAATNDLAQLIMTLNLEATPSNTPNVTPLRRSPDDENSTDRLSAMPESPLSKTLRKGMASISSLRPYAQSLRKSGSQLLLGSSPKNTLKKKPSKSGPESLIGQQIAPWSKLMEGLSPKKSMTFSSGSVNKDKGKLSPASISRPTVLRPSVSPPSTFRKGHRRQMTPAPEPEPEPVFQPLRPAARPRTGNSIISPPNPASLPNESLDSSLEVGRGGVVTKNAVPTIRATSSSNTFGTPSPARSSKNKSKSSSKVPIPPETRRILGMSGTLGMGGSDLPAMYAVPEMDAASDPDSDIPDELQFILKAGNSDENPSFKMVVQDLLDDDENDTFSFPLSTDSYGPSGLPPTGPLPIPSGDTPSRIVDDDENDTGRLSVGERECFSEFDFTEELKKLDESVGADSKSFVEQLETAFMTPAKVELDFDLLGKGLLNGARPISKLPFEFSKNDAEKEQEDRKDGTPSQSTSRFDSRNEMFKVSKLVDEKEPTTMTTTTAEASSRSKSVLDLCTSGSQILNMMAPSLVQTEDESAKLNMSTSTSSSNRSNGELNTSFKFGGLPKSQASPAKSEQLTLSDIIPPLSHARSLSESSLVLEDDSVLKSIYAKAKTGAVPQPRSRVNSNASSKRRSRMTAREFLVQSRPTSMLSFTGLDSFEEIRRTFEFCGPRPTLYPPTSSSNKGANHHQRDSVLSIASVSSYGRVINPGINDPFGFSLSRLQERPSSEDISATTFSFSIDDTFSFLHHPSRRVRVDSDASSFYFHSESQGSHRRQDSRMSYISATGGPPISFYNRNFAAHRRSGSSASSYAMYSASGGRASWAKHKHDTSTDSVMSDLAALRLGRPGIGDKMFDMSDQRMPVSFISMSPLEQEHSSLIPQYSKSSSYEDSILDICGEPKSLEDSLFDKTSNQRPVGMESLFVNDSSIGAGFLPRYRPVSVISIPGVYIPPQEDDTWISMIGGGHVRRNSVASNIQASPCARVEKRRRTRFQPFEEQVLPKVVEVKPSFMSTTSSHFGGERMVDASKGLLERQSLEDSCLVAEGEDSSLSFRSAPVFTRPVPVGRSRSSTCTSSSGGETPPLSSDGSSVSGGSQSSIDLSQLDSLLANATFPSSNPGLLNRTRPRARGHGHRRRYSAARASRTSVYETIEEEPLGDSPAHTVRTLQDATSTTIIQPIIVDSDTGSFDVTVSDSSCWNTDRVVTLNKCYALRHEADDVVDASKRQWVDTPFSVFAIQNFDPPRNPEGMKALLQHSVQTYGPLPSELRLRRRSRTHSRPSPYPLARVSRVFYPPESTRASTSPQGEQTSIPKIPSMVLQEINVNSNVAPSPAPSFKFKARSPEKSPAVKRTAPFGQPPIRPRVASTTRRAALGWTKRGAKSSNGDHKENKENKENVSYGSIKTPGESLRLNRPRPRARATPATTQVRTIRV